MEFCDNCDNIFYIKLEKNNISYFCKKCKNTKKINLGKNKQKKYLIKTNIQQKKNSYEHMINEYTKYDNTLPRINHIKCPKCSSNKQYIETSASDLINSGINSESVESNEGSNLESVESKEDSKPKSVESNEGSNLESVESKEDSKPKSVESNEDSIPESESDSKFTTEASSSISNSSSSGGGDLSKKNEVIYIRYNDIDLKYIYLCCNCDFIWKI